MSVQGDGTVDVTSNVTLGTLAVTGHAMLTTVSATNATLGTLSATRGTITQLQGTGATFGNIRATNQLRVDNVAIIKDLAVTNLILPTTIAQPVGATYLMGIRVAGGTLNNTIFAGNNLALIVEGSALITKGLSVTDLEVTGTLITPDDISIDIGNFNQVNAKYMHAGFNFTPGFTGGSTVLYSLYVSQGEAIFDADVNTSFYGPVEAIDIDTHTLTGITASLQRLTVGTTIQANTLGVTGQATVGSLAVNANTQTNTLSVTGAATAGALVVGTTIQANTLGVTGQANIGSLSVTSGITANTVYALSGISLPGGINMNNAGLMQIPKAIIQDLEIVSRYVVDASAEVIIPTSYHSAVLATQMVAGTTDASFLVLYPNTALDVSGSMLVTAGISVNTVGPYSGRSVYFPVAGGTVVIENSDSIMTILQPGGRVSSYTSAFTNVVGVNTYYNGSGFTMMNPAS